MPQVELLGACVFFCCAVSCSDPSQDENAHPHAGGADGGGTPATDGSAGATGGRAGLDASDSSVPSGTSACDDGIDDDADGVADYPGDAGCSSPYDDDESGDALVTIGCELSASELNICIGGSSAPACCDSSGASAHVTVRSLDTVRQTVTGSVNPQKNVSYNHLALTGGIDAKPDQDGFRFVDDEVLGGFYVGDGNDDWVLQDCVFDGDTDNVGCGDDVPAQIWCPTAGCKNVRIVGNEFRGFWNDNPADHSEAMNVGGDVTDLMIYENLFQHDGSTAHLFFTWFPGSGSGSHHRACVAGNDFRETGGEDPTACGGNAAYFAVNSNTNGGAVSFSSVHVDPAQANDFAGLLADQGGGDPVLAPCNQCLNGIDDDGDGRMDLWDPDCTDGNDDSESE